MPRISDKITINNPELDRRVKLLPEQKEEIRKRWKKHVFKATNNLIGEAISQRSLAREYGVSRRTIIFVLYPERRVSNYQTRVKRGGSPIYYRKYGKESWRKTMKNHRDYKKELYQKGLI